MSGLEKAAASKILSNKFTTYRKVRAIFEVHTHNISRQLKAILPEDATEVMVEFATSGGASSIGAHPTGGSSGGSPSGKWIEKYLLPVSGGETLYMQVGRGGIPTDAGTYTFSASNDAGDTYIKLDSHGGRTLMNLFRGNALRNNPSAPTATRGASNVASTDGSNQQINATTPADAAAGVVGTSMASIPVRTTQFLSSVYPPLNQDNPPPYGFYGTTPGSGAGINAGVGLQGGFMGLYDNQPNDPYAGGVGSGAIAGGGSGSFGLHVDKYSALCMLDPAISAFKKPNSGATNVNVDTQNQELWGAGATGAATGHRGGYGGDGVICISFWTAQTNIDPIWNNPFSLIDVTNNPNGYLVPNTFFGIHGWASAFELANGKVYNSDTDSTNVPTIMGTVTVNLGVATWTCAAGHSLINARKNMGVIIVGFGIAGANFETRFNESAFFGSLTTGTSVTATLIDVPPNISGAPGTHQLRLKAYNPPYAFNVIRTHDSNIDWARVALGGFNGTLTSGNNVITGVSLINRSGYTSLLPNQSIKVGQAVVGAGIPANTTITALAAGQITMSNNATANGAVSGRIYNKPVVDLLINSPMFAGKKWMAMMSGTPEWLASSIVQPTTRTVSGTSVTINHAALPFAMPVNLQLLVRNSSKTSINGSDPVANVNFKVTASTTTSTTYTTPTATGNETAVADTTVELIPMAAEVTYGYQMPPNPTVGDGYGEVNNYITWLLTNYGTHISHIDGWNEPNTAWRHGGVARLNTDNPRNTFWLGAREVLGEICRRCYQTAKSLQPSVQVGSPSITGIAYGQQFYISDFDSVVSRSNVHFLLSASDNATGKMLDWCDYIGIHMYSTSANWRLNNQPSENIITWLRFIKRLVRMESINKPNLPFLMTEGGHDFGTTSRTRFYALNDTDRANEIFKWFALQAGWGVRGVYPFLNFFLGDPECNAADEAAYIKVGQRLVGKTIHPDSCYNQYTGSMYFKTTDGFEEYIP